MPLGDLPLAFALVFAAEFGDKTQVAVALLASRGRPQAIVLGACAAFLLLTALACTVGAAVAHYVPARLLRAAAGALFLVLAALALRHRDEAEAAAPRASFVGTFLTIALAEMGDKTQIATATLAAGGNALLVGIGAFLALATSAVLAALLGAKLLARLPPRALRWVAFAAFALAGVALLVEAALG